MLQLVLIAYYSLKMLPPSLKLKALTLVSVIYDHKLLYLYLSILFLLVIHTNVSLKTSLLLLSVLCALHKSQLTGLLAIVVDGALTLGSFLALLE